ncbi:MAG: hypothetical protein ABIB43_03040 [archaeon]
MATFMDIGILSNFSIIFVFLLIFAVMFAVLEKSSPFGKDKKGLHGIIALAIAFLIIISDVAVSMINVLTPWFVVLFIFIFFVLFALRMFGASESDTIALIKSRQFFPYLIIIIVLIVIGALSSTFGQQLLEKGTGIDGEDIEPGIVLPGDIEGGSTKTTSFGENVLNTLIHPKVLGLIAIMLIGLFTIVFLTKLA